MAHWGRQWRSIISFGIFRIENARGGPVRNSIRRKAKTHLPARKGFIETAQAFFQKNDKLDKKARIAAYSDAMEKWYASHFQ